MQDIQNNNCRRFR